LLKREDSGVTRTLTSLSWPFCAAIPPGSHESFPPRRAPTSWSAPGSRLSRTEPSPDTCCPFESQCAWQPYSWAAIPLAGRLPVFNLPQCATSGIGNAPTVGGIRTEKLRRRGYTKAALRDCRQDVRVTQVNDPPPPVFTVAPRLSAGERCAIDGSECSSSLFARLKMRF